MDYLFSTYYLYSKIEQWRKNIENKISNLPPQDILGVDLNVLADEIAEEFHVSVPILHEDLIEADHEEADIDMSHDFRDVSSRESGPARAKGLRIIFSIPFSGDHNMFQVQASRRTLSPPRAEVTKSSILVSFRDINLKPEAVNAEFERILKGIKDGLEWIQKDVDSFHVSLPAYIRQLLKTREEKLERNADIIKGLKYPLRMRPQNERPVIDVTPKRVISPREERLQGRKTPAEPAIDIKEYDHILEIIKNMSHVMERSPKAFREMDEESLRQHFLVQLNGVYEGSATGETFNYSGKTDILIREDGRNIFLAECKFWKGPSCFMETINQIIGYTSWRDTKTAILLFVKNKNFSDVLKQIAPTVRGHQNFVQELQCGGETDFRFLFTHKDDSNRRLYLSVSAFTVPSV